MILEAINYKMWADERTLLSIDNIDQHSFPESYAFVLQQISHMVIVDEMFKSRLMKSPVPHESTYSEVVPEFSELKFRLIESGKWYRRYASKRDKKSGRTVSFTFADGKMGSMSVDEILFHVINHGSYHRGSIAHALDLATVPHPADGYGIYIHEKEPERRNKT